MADQCDDGTMSVTTSPPPHADTARGLMLMLTASVMFGIMGAAAKQANTVLSFWETTFWRSVVTLVLVSVLIWLGRRRETHAATVGRFWLWMRGLTGTLGLLCYFFAISRIPLAQALMLNSMTPLFTTLLAALVLKERLQPAALIGLGVGLVGVYLIVDPQGGQLNIGTALGLLSSLFSAMAYVIVRRLSATHDPWVVVWHLSAMGLILAAPGTLAAFHPLAGSLFAAVGLMGLAATVAQGTMTMAYRHLPAGTGSTAGLFTVCVGTLIGWAWFGEIPSTAALVGGALILLGGIGANLGAFSRLRTPSIGLR